MTSINLGEMQLAQRMVTKQGEEKEANMLLFRTGCSAGHAVSVAAQLLDAHLQSPSFLRVPTIWAAL
jgi:hypothetical protein